ncbi:MAG: gas vesicle protein GvpN [Bacillota bacterium]
MYKQGEEPNAIFMPRPGADFVQTSYIAQLTSRALDYLKIGLPVHFCGSAGVGKTTLALHVAARVGRPVVIIYGDYELGTPDLVGGLYGYRKRKVMDNFIRSVMKADESMDMYWTDGRLVTACKNGFTLVYDEFTRSRPEANNVLLSVLEERMLPLPPPTEHGGYIKVHPEFSAIFTSNPREYAGVQKTPDALLDRMVTIELGNFDEETEVAITQAKARVPLQDAKRIVELVRKVRETKADKSTPTVRSCIMIGKLLELKGCHASVDDPMFERICMDVLMPEVPRSEREAVGKAIQEAIGFSKSEVSSAWPKRVIPETLAGFSEASKSLST